MLENCKTATERWGGVNQIIDRWLQSRQDMLVKYCTLSDTASEGRAQYVRGFCESMVDYVSAGHFEIYDQLALEGKEFDDKDALKQGAKLFKEVDETTEAILDFNDKYLETDDLSSIDADLSSIGETLETRFSAEDGMIAVLHRSHKDLVA